MYHALVLSVLLYGSETWSLKATDIKRLNAFHMKCIRGMLKISYLDRISNEEVKKRSGEDWVKLIARRQLRRIWYISRMYEKRYAKKAAQ